MTTETCRCEEMREKRYTSGAFVGLFFYRASDGLIVPVGVSRLYPDCIHSSFKQHT
jgi:hypothetical protein